MDNINSKKNNKKVKKVKNVLSIVGTLFFSMILIVIITGSVFVTAITIYVLNFADVTGDEVTLDDIKLKFTSQILAKNPNYDGTNNEYEVYYTLSSDGDKMVWVDLSNVPTCVRDAFVYSEDERFYNHDGVDFKRTFAAFVNIFVPIYNSSQGGSTITQQTIKNITRDDAQNGLEGVTRKIREIVRSINMEDAYTKDDILEAYLNIIYLGRAEGSNYYGVQAAANFYFGKDIKDLDIAEAATIAAINKDPTFYNPYSNRTNNKERTKYVLLKMYENGAISSEEYYAALAEIETMDIVGDTEYSSDGIEITKRSEVSSYFVDATISQAIDELVSKYGISYEDATKRLYSGGYKIYTTVDLNMQKQLEQKFLDDSNFQSYKFDGDTLLSAFICMDYRGDVKAVIGGRGEKESFRCWNNATMSVRSPGSTIKPLASYAPAIEQNLATWSTLLKDEPLNLAAAGQQAALFPKNYADYGDNDPHWTKKNMTVAKMLEESTNTGPAQLVRMLTPSYCFNFMQNNLGFTTLVLKDDSGRSDIDYSPMTVGALTEGVKLSELTASYEIFGNGGQFYGHTFITSIVDQQGKPVYEHNYYGAQVIQPATSYVMNRMMKNVVEGKDGTGKAAKLNTTEVVAKTGTSENWQNLTFIGCTPDYVSGLWLGHDKLQRIDTTKYQSIAKIWNNVFGEIAESASTKTFTPCADVVELKYCTDTGLIAHSGCKNTAIGYYKSDNVPATCNKCKKEEAKVPAAS